MQNEFDSRKIKVFNQNFFLKFAQIKISHQLNKLLSGKNGIRVFLLMQIKKFRSKHVTTSKGSISGYTKNRDWKWKRYIISYKLRIFVPTRGKFCDPTKIPDFFIPQLPEKFRARSAFNRIVTWIITLEYWTKIWSHMSSYPNEFIKQIFINVYIRNIYQHFLNMR